MKMCNVAGCSKLDGHGGPHESPPAMRRKAPARIEIFVDRREVNLEDIERLALMARHAGLDSNSEVEIEQVEGGKSYTLSLQEVTRG